MSPFTVLESRVVPLALANFDTDQLVPARFLARKREDGFAMALFQDLKARAQKAGTVFVTERPEYADAKILLAGRNFGCGSSRESAVWALVDAGFRAVVAPSFGDIFFGNAFKNGLLPIVLSQDEVESLTLAVEQDPAVHMLIDLADQAVRLGGQLLRFDVDPLRKLLLLNGLDELDFTLRHASEIAAFAQQYQKRQPWLGS